MSLPLVAHLPGKHDQSTHGKGSTSPEEFDRRADSAVSGPDVLKMIPVNPNSESLNKASREAVISYMGTGFEGVNSALRGESRTDRVTRRKITGMDDAMELSALRSDVVVWRGMETGRGVFGDRLKADLAGFSWTEKSYVSTSHRRNTAEIFATHQKERPGVLVRMVAPRGVQAVELYGGEGEALLQRGLQMRVVKDYGHVQIAPPDAFGRSIGPPQPTRVLDVEILP